MLCNFLGLIQILL